MNDGHILVSVVVPAFNAADTIQETLDSISAQTYRTLEVVVVDDGSTDRTSAIAQGHSLRDPRVRVVFKPNGGVASARNEGIRVTRGAFIAFIDADDLWHPTKIEKQLAVLLSAEPETALIYSPFRSIDAEGNVFASPHKYGVSGWVIHRHFYSNFVGNGSSLLVRRHVLEELGGFDPSLRHMAAEGCEDLLLQLRIAKHYRFGEVAEYLVGYRRFPGNMSSDSDQMIRSGALAVGKALSECHDIPGLCADAMLNRYEWKRVKATILKGQIREGLIALAKLSARSPEFVASATWAEIQSLTGKAIGMLRARVQPRNADEAPRHFYEFDPRSGIDLRHDTPTSRALRRLANKDDAYRPQARPPTDQPARSLPHTRLKAVPQGAFASGKLEHSSTCQKG
jgi:glycosyltransferase involved in cell wall biosynthesis